MGSRRLEDLLPELELIARQFLAVCAAEGIPLLVTCTYRTQDEQDRLYEQGRTRPGKIVTWTHKSKHIDRKAFDVVVLKQGKPVWDLKIDVDDDEIPDYEEIGKIGESLGLVWGGRWKSPDYPHFELREA